MMQVRSSNSLLQVLSYEEKKLGFLKYFVKQCSKNYYSAKKEKKKHKQPNVHHAKKPHQILWFDFSLFVRILI